MAKEYNYGWNDHHAVYIRRKTIRPLLCSEIPDASFANRCSGPDDRLPVYLKEATFNFIVTESIVLRNIILDGIEDIREL